VLSRRRPDLPASQAALTGRLHTKRRDQDAIAFHYDLSNDFYALILDDLMAYSCAYWLDDQPDLPIGQAQSAKLDLICRKLHLQPGQRFLDVGCGWGALVLHAAEYYGVTAIGVTLSAEQAAVAHDRVRSRGLSNRVEIQTRHYQDFTASKPFDAVASIEMGEHVGQDMHMRRLSATVGMLEDAGWEVRGVQAMREHYVRTVREWLATLEERWAQAVELVGVETARVWRLYLAGGALAFEQGRMGVDQILAA